MKQKNEIVAKIGTTTMTLKEITDLLEVRHDKAMRKVEEMVAAPEFGTVAVLDIVYNKHGQTIETYGLDKRQSLAVASRLNTALLMRVIDRWQELEAEAKPQFNIPSTLPEALRLAADIQEKLEAAELKIENQTARLGEKDQLIKASNEASIKAGEITVSEFCKAVDIVDVGSKTFYQWMRSKGYLFQDSCEPRQEYVNRGYFTWKPSEVKHGGKFRYTLRITPRGKIWLASKYLAHLDKHDAA